MNIVLRMQTAFWISIGFIGYAYLGYPLLLMLIGVVRNRSVGESGLNGCNGCCGLSPSEIGEVTI
jgi:hypothetical protein